MDWSRSTFDVKFEVEGTPFSLTSIQRSNHVKSEWIITPVACGSRMQLFLIPDVKVRIDEIRCDVDLKVKSDDTLFFNGYQSWTDSREWHPKDKMPHLSSLAKPLIKKFNFDRYGDTVVRTISHRRGHLHGFNFSKVRSKDQVNFF